MLVLHWIDSDHIYISMSTDFLTSIFCFLFYFGRYFITLFFGTKQIGQFNFRKYFVLFSI